MSGLVQVDEGMWTKAVDHSFYGLHLGTRMTIVRLQSGGLFVHSPIALTPERREAVDALGPVEHIVCPNVYHHIYAGEWVAAYPDATLYAPSALRKKRPDLNIDVELSDECDFGGELVPHSIGGSILRETVFLHQKTRTLISADLVENFSSHSHWMTRAYLKAGGIYGKLGWSRLMRVVYRDRKIARRDFEKLYTFEFERLVLSHGEILEERGREQLREAMSWL